MKKKGIEYQLAYIIAIVVAAVVFLTLLWPAFSTLFKGAAAKGECNWNLFLSAAVKAGSLGFTEIPPGCKAEYTTIDSKTLATYHKLAKKRIDKYNSDTTGYYSNAKNVFGKNDYNTWNEWALDYLMGKRLTECWDKVWHGKLDFFTRNIISGSRTFCVVCSVVSFSDDMPTTINKKQIDSLHTWTTAEPYYKTTYYDYFTDGVTIKPTPQMMIFSTQSPQAVVYMEAKASWAKEHWFVSALISPAGSALVQLIQSGDQDLKQLIITPYESLRGTCTDIIA